MVDTTSRALSFFFFWISAIFTDASPLSEAKTRMGPWMMLR